MTIPKKFHYIWIGPEEMPQRYVEFIRGWQELHPDWVFMAWDEGNIPKLFNQNIYEIAPDWASKSDIIRYELLWRYGGVYIDVDMEPIKNIEPLLVGVDSFACKMKNDLVNNAVMGCTPNHPLARALVQNLQAWTPRKKGSGAVHFTGPDYLTWIIHHASQDTKVYEPDLFYPVGWVKARSEPSAELYPNSYAVHRWNSVKESEAE